MSSASRFRERLLGTVLNKADVRKVRWLLSPKIAFLNKSRGQSAFSESAKAARHSAQNGMRANKVMVKAAAVALALAAAVAAVFLP